MKALPNPIKWFAARLASSASVRRAVVARLADHPDDLAELGKKPAAFTAILDGAARSETALVSIIDHPTVLPRIMRSPKAFDILLAAVGKNPESLYRILGKRGLRSALPAQNDFLKAIAQDPKVLAKVAEHVPRRAKAALIQRLVAEEAAYLQPWFETPDRMVAALTFREGQTKPDADMEEALDMSLIQGMIACLEDNASEVLLELIIENPNLFDHEALQDHAVRAIQSSPERISQLCALYAVTPEKGSSSSDRVSALLQRLFQEPIVLQAVLKDPDLRGYLFAFVRDSIEAKGETVESLMDAPRKVAV